MACLWKPLCNLSLESKSADLSPGHLANPTFFYATVLFRIHGHLVVPTGECSMSCCSMDTWLSQLVNVRCVAVWWTHGCSCWWIIDLVLRWYICQAVFCVWSLVMVWLWWWYICQAVFCEWSMVMVWFWRWWICQAVFCDWSMEIGQVGILSLMIHRHLGSWVLAFPWGSIISGFGHSHLRLWMLISLPSDADFLPSDCVILLFFRHHFLLRCAVIDFMIAVLCSLITHIVVIIMFAIAFYMIVLMSLLLCLLQDDFCFWYCIFDFSTLLRSLDLQYSICIAVLPCCFDCCICREGQRVRVPLSLHLFCFYFSMDIFLNELSFTYVVGHLF